MPSANDELLTIGEAAERLRISRSSLYDRLRDGSIPTVRLGPRIVRVRTSDLDAFLELRSLPHAIAV